LPFFRPLRADLSIKKSSSFFPRLIAATSQRGFAPRPAQVSPDGPRYFGGTFFPFNALPPPRTTLETPQAANCCSSSARCLLRVSSTRFRRSISPSTLIAGSYLNRFNANFLYCYYACSSQSLHRSGLG